MQMTLTAAEQSFRDEVRAFLADSLPSHIVDANRRKTTVWVEREIALEWQAILYAKGWLASFWPVEHGGTGWTKAQRYIFESEAARAGAPTLVPMGLKYVGPVIYSFGNALQKSRYLPKILTGEHYWCQGYSEPGAGSDLAAVQCQAVLEGDHYRVNGSKIWTTHAHYATHIFCLVRSAKMARKQQGITFLLIDMATPGVTVRPIITMAGDHEVNQVFFDDVMVPVTDRIGEEHQGWSYAKFLLDYERGGTAAASPLRFTLDQVEMIARAAPDGDGAAMADRPDIRTAITRLRVDLDCLEMTELRLLHQDGPGAGTLASLVKTVSSELEQAINDLACEVLGPESLRFAEPADLYGHLRPRQLNSRAASIYGGANEIQRDIIAAGLTR